jgi:predicted nucleotidyltransferase
MSKLSVQSAFRYPLSTVFSGQVAVRVGRELYVHGGPLTIRELVARTGATRKSVSVVVGSLLSLGLVRRVGSAQTGLFQVVTEHPLFAPLAALFGAEDERIRNTYDAIRQAAAETFPQPLAVWLYGSVARGEDTPRSDLDVAVCADDNEVEEVVDAMREALRLAGQQLAVRFSLVGLSPRDIIRLATERDPFWTSLTQDARTLSGPEPEDFLRLRRHEQHPAAGETE